MSIRLRLFLFIAGLVTALVLAQLWLIRALTHDLEGEIAAAAESVSRSVVSVLRLEIDPSRRVLVRVDDSEVDDGEAESDVESGVERGGLQGSIEVRRTAESLGDGEARVVEFKSGYLGAFEDLEAFGIEGPIAEIVGEVEAGAEGPHAVWVSTGRDGNVFSHRFDNVSVHQRGENTLVLKGPELETPVPVPTEGIANAVARFSGRLLGGSLGLAMAGLLIGAVLAHRLTGPLRELAAAAEEVGSGAFGTQVPERGGGEVGRALRAFNQMSAHLDQLDADARSLRARQHLSELGEVGRGLAHTLRNPLNALGLSIEELAMLASDPDRRATDRPTELAVAARRQIRRMDSSLRAFLALGSRGSGALTEVDVLAMAQDVALECLQDAPSSQRPSITVDTADGATTSLRAVEPEVRAALQALVVNAAEASLQGAAISIRLSARANDQLGVRIEVEDEGPGVPPEVRPRLFSPHVTTKAHGSGMGLYLAQRIATHRYAGSVRLQDRLPRGTIAILELGDRLEEPDA